ncbi:MAG: cation diffusion facilitator family transporter [Rhodospirillaceae bacterium]|nr:cation diffusion facilitator family transporter [Rhodospirillaceae bacterium]MBT4219902.1 cation diffusion facilitator family transporter [Rhodospirillaceae bacterium]MBT4463457.1 cation diffusion facilitator family transporter [Rhodospirillaceae bacterium]MBT5013090.1 cation diffusion facilitator family transporter [Rhodospirillaceae bacterium]MBT5309202.1 cation diffusion facilitator family transporter [Rhodospirillaceae bacterium]
MTTETSSGNVRLLTLATYVAVATASGLVLVKFFAWQATGAVSLLSTLLDSLLDVGASFINLLAVRHALQPADEEHRFGHGKAEPLAGLAQAAFISGSAVFLLLEAGERLFNPRQVVNADIGYAVMALSVAVTLALVIFQRYVVKKTGSVAIQADSMHYRMDVLVNISVIGSLFLASQFGWLLADPLFALAIAAYIFHGAWEVGSQSLHLLMDRELPNEDRERIVEIANAHPDVRGMHDLRTRSSGNKTFIQLHLEMDPDLALRDAHVIAEAVMYSIEKAFPDAEVMIHEDPEGVQERRLDFD